MDDPLARKAITALVRAVVFRDTSSLKSLATTQLIELIEDLDIDDTWKVLLVGVLHALSEWDTEPLQEVALHFIDRIVQDAISELPVDDEWKTAFNTAWRLTIAGAEGGKDEVLRELSRILKIEGLPERVDALVQAVNAKDYHAIFSNALNLGSFVLRNFANVRIGQNDPNRQRLLDIADGLDKLKAYVDRFAKIASEDFSDPKQVRRALDGGLALAEDLEKDIRAAGMVKLADGLELLVAQGKNVQRTWFWEALPVFIAALAMTATSDPCKSKEGGAGAGVQNASAGKLKEQPFIRSTDTTLVTKWVKPGALLRGQNPSSSLYRGYRNLGVLVYRHKDKPSERIAIPSSGFDEGRAGTTNHAEKKLAEKVRGVAGFGCDIMVIEVYTERTPCKSCANALADIAQNDNLGSDIKVYFISTHALTKDDLPSANLLRAVYNEEFGLKWW